MAAERGNFRIEARPQAPAEEGLAGLSELPLPGERASFLYAPRGRASAPAPLLLILHGAGGNSHQALGILRPMADTHGLVLLAPASQGFTWDIILDDYGPDVERIDRALRHVFQRYRIDGARLGIAGFSDGASYALSVGLANGDLFTHVIAFSPGFAAPAARVDRPRVFVSHGMGDPVLPVASCSRRIVAQLRHNGLDVEYFEFDGGHVVPAPIARAALHWFLPSPAAASG